MNEFDLVPFNSRLSDSFLCFPIPSQLSPSPSIPSVSFYFVSYILFIEIYSLFVLKVSPYGSNTLLAIPGNTKISMLQAVPCKSHLGLKSNCPQFYPLQIPAVAFFGFLLGHSCTSPLMHCEEERKPGGRLVIFS